MLHHSNSWCLLDDVILLNVSVDVFYYNVWWSSVFFFWNMTFKPMGDDSSKSLSVLFEELICCDNLLYLVFLPCGECGRQLRVLLLDFPMVWWTCAKTRWSSELCGVLSTVRWLEWQQFAWVSQRLTALRDWHLELYRVTKNRKTCRVLFGND